VTLGFILIKKDVISYFIGHSIYRVRYRG